jgi:hypothetical protein
LIAVYWGVGGSDMPFESLEAQVEFAY